MNNKDLAAKSIKDIKLNVEKMTVLDLIHYSTIKEIVNILSYDYDYVNNAINFSIPESMKKFTKEIHFKRMPNYVAMLKKTKKISQVAPKVQIIKTPDEIAKIKIIPKNILFKGVPGTGKSRTIDNIIQNVLLIKDFNKVLKINVHDSTSNSDLMQGIGISTNQNSNISYREKSGLILSFIEKAILDPQNEYALVLEEVQENSLNKIIGDLIYLIEKDKRTIVELEDINQFSSSDPYILVNSLIIKRKKEQQPIYFVALPNLIENTKNKNLVFPSNLYVFCTTNYRDDKKIIEDNLLRRFDVIELYPNGEFITNLAIKEIFTQLNDCILEIMSTQESHPDRFMIGQAIWMEDDNDILKPMLKTFIEFKDVRNIDFSNAKDIINLLITKINDSNIYKDDIIEMSTKKNYKELLDYLQKEVYKGII